MSVPELSNIPIHEEITFFRPMLEATRKLLDAVEKKLGTPLKPDLNCYYAPSKGQQRPWDELYLISSEWEPVRLYFMRKAPLYYFYEPPMRGLVNKDGQFWIFPEFEQLKQLAFRERLKLNELSPKAAKQIPFQNVQTHFEIQIDQLLHDVEKIYSLRAQECEKYLKLVNHYLPKDQAMEVQKLARTLLKEGLHNEIKELIRILDDKVLVDHTKLKRRIRAVHTLSMKYYFFRAPDEEKQKIDCLVGRDKGSQLDALKYIERKVSLSFELAKKRQAAQGN